MSHVDDGILHAYLDGALDSLSDAGEIPDGATASDVVAHLSSCADCRARLEAERAIREGAGVILGDAAPPRVAAPPLPVQAALPGRRRARWVPLRWAATVLLALGGGWWGSELWRTQLMSTAAVEQAEPSSQRSNASEAANAVSPAASAGPMASDHPASPEAGSADPRSDAALAGEPRPVDTRSAAARAGEPPPVDTRSDAAMAGEPPPVDTRSAAALAGEPTSAEPSSAMSAREPLGTESRLANIPAASQPIAAAAGDRPAVTESRLEAARVAQNAQATPGVPLQPATASGPVRPLQSAAVPESSTLVQPWPVDAAGLKTFAGDFAGLAAFDSISTLEQSGALRFAPASASDLGTIRRLVYLVANGSEPSIEVAHAPLRTVVRVQQTLPSGEHVELISWHPHAPAGELAPQAIALDAIVVTGVPLREARLDDARRRGRAAEAQPDSAADAVPVAFEPVRGVRTLEDGRDQLVLRSASGDVWLALRGRLTADELHALVAGLRQHPLR